MTQSGRGYSGPLNARRKKTTTRRPCEFSLHGRFSKCLLRAEVTSNGLVTVPSYGGLTFSGIGQSNCCTSPEWPVGWKTRPRHSPSGPFFSTTKVAYAETRSQKSRRATDNFPWSGWASPFRGTEVRDEGEEASTSPPVRHPTTAVQENGTYGGQGKGAGAVQRLCCVNSAFLCSRSHRANSIRDQMRVRLTLKRPVIVPHTAKRRKLWPRPARASGPSFLERTRITVCNTHAPIRSRIPPGVRQAPRGG